MPAAARSELDGRSAAGLLEVAARDFRPPLRQSVSDYAQSHRFLQGLGGGRGDRWRNEVTPYLVEPMECLDSGQYLTVAIVGPGQVGKTVVPENWLLKAVATDPANMLWYMHSDEVLEAFVKDRINPMIEDHEILRRNQGLKAVDDSLHYKRFKGMSVQFLTASMGNLISKSAPRIVADEIDAYRKIFGDIKVLLDIRRQRFKLDSMLLAISHPDLAKGLRPETDWNAGIMSMYADSTRCLWYWECPHCSGWSSPCPTAPRMMSIEYPSEGTLDEIEAGAYLFCPVNGCVIAEKDRLAMNRTGVWIGEGQEISKEGRISGQRVARKTAGFWIVGAMSPFTLGGIGALARARVKAERERDNTGEDDSLRQVIVKQWGVPYAPSRPVGSVDANDLADRAEVDLKLGVVPIGARFITLAVDCQISTFEYLGRAWGAAGESWVIDRGKILADPATSADDWDKLLKLFQKTYPLGDGSQRAMGIRACGFDTAGAAGVSQQAYAAWTRWRKRPNDQKVIKLYGHVNKREAWSILGLKGANTINAPKLQISYPDTGRRANVKASRGAVPIGLFNPNQFKDDLAGQLMRADAGPFYIHFPYELRGSPPAKERTGPVPYPIEPPHVWFEQVVAERSLANGRWEKIAAGARNEALDLLVMTHVLAHLHGLNQITWEKPPPWAADWNANTSIVQTTGPGVDVPTQKRGRGVSIKIDATAKKSIASRLA